MLKTIVFFEGKPDQINQILSIHENPFMGMQVIDRIDSDSDGDSIVTEARDLPLQMMTFWHARPPVDGLIPNTDASIVRANLEVNVNLSAIFDTIAFQTHAVPVMNLNNPSSPRAKRRTGSRFPMVLDITETFNYVSAATNYVQQVEALKDFVRMTALAKRFSPNDFAIDGAVATSGFSKLVDSLPKLEARREHLRRLRHIETQVAAPRIVSILTKLGSLDEDAVGLRMRVKFADIEFPKTEDEIDKEIARDIKYGFSSAAQILAKREGISVDEAESRIQENNARRPAEPQQAAQFPRLGGLIGQRG